MWLAFVLLTRSCSKGTSLRKHPFPSGEERGETDVFAGYKGTQRQFSENICSEDDLRSRIFGTFVVKSCLPASPRIFEHLKNAITAHF